MKNLLFLACLIPGLNSFAGRSDTVQIYCQEMKKNIPCLVIRPSNYEKSRTPIPMVYLLHGYGSNFCQWITISPQLRERVDQFNFLIVCPDGGYGSWYFDSPFDSSVRYETFISRELVNYIDHHYRTIPGRNFRAISGLSMGGHGGLYLGIRHRDVFGAAGSSSGVVDFPDLPIRGQGHPGKGQNSAGNSVMKCVDGLKNRQIRIIFDCGTSDWLIYVNRKLHQKLLEKGIDHDYSERPGKHNALYWNNSIDYQLLFFHKFFDESIP
jgi:S-formylglutathione hydrolase FrmB